jgi:EmrB/QacA subfamily drug resistance transporter
MDDTLSQRAIVDCTRRRDTPGAMTLLTLCLAVLVAQVDTAVVNLATRAIGDHFSAGVIALQWVIDSYNLVYAVLLLTGGLLADLYGRRRIFMIGAALFTIASLICAIAPSISILIFGRALAGVGAALLLPASLAIIRVAWNDEAERGRALGIWAACNGLAMALGPTLGGLLINRFGWRSIFIVVIPLSVAALGLAVTSITESSDPKGRQFDASAQIVGAVALGSLAFAAIQSHDAPVIAVIAFVIAVLALIVFIRIESKHGAAALVPLDIFQSRKFLGAVIATTAMTFGMYGTLFLLPLTWQSVGRFDATWAGLALMPMALIFVIVSPFSGKLTQTFGVRLVTCGGVIIIGSGLLLIGISTHQASILAAELGLSLTGLGMGFATGPLMGAAVAAVAAARSGTASALINVARMAGATVGVAILGAIYAVAQGGAGGLRHAMLFGGALQITCAAIAYTTMASRQDSPN